MDTVSSFVSVPPPKKSSPGNAEIDLSLSSKGGKPNVFTCIMCVVNEAFVCFRISLANTEKND